MQGGGESEAGGRSVVYCLVPRDLAAKLHESLRRHFDEDPQVEVIVERRRRERRAGARRRSAEAGAPAVERRAVRNEEGRRAGDRRASVVGVAARELPRRARRHVDRLVFVERLEPGGQHAEDLDTARLVIGFQAGDRDAFSTLYMRYFDRLYGYMRMALKDPHEAEDATQQVLTQVLEALPRYERRSRPFRAWLFSVARNRALDQLEKQGRLEPVDPAKLRRVRERSGAEAPAADLLDWITDRDLALFVGRLPPAQRQVLVLKYMLGLNAAEIAQVLDRSPADVRSLHHRGLTFLRERLAAVGRGPKQGRGIRMRSWPKPAQVLRRRRFALDP